jgi:hypothetical protein
MEKEVTYNEEEIEEQKQERLEFFERKKKQAEEALETRKRIRDIRHKTHELIQENFELDEYGVPAYERMDEFRELIKEQKELYYELNVNNDEKVIREYEATIQKYQENIEDLLDE